MVVASKTLSFAEAQSSGNPWMDALKTGETIKAQRASTARADATAGRNAQAFDQGQQDRQDRLNWGSDLLDAQSGMNNQRDFAAEGVTRGYVTTEPQMKMIERAQGRKRQKFARDVAMDMPAFVDLKTRINRTQTPADWENVITNAEKMYPKVAKKLKLSDYRGRFGEKNILVQKFGQSLDQMSQFATSQGYKFGARGEITKYDPPQGQFSSVLDRKRAIKYAEGKGTAEAKTWVAKTEAIETAGYAADERIAELEQASAALSGPGYTGAYGDTILAIKKIGVMLGVDLGGTIDTEVFQAIANKLAVDRSTLLKGSASDKDVELIKESGPSLNKSRVANRILLEFALSVARRDKFVSETADQWMEQNSETTLGPKFRKYLRKKEKGKDFFARAVKMVQMDKRLQKRMGKNPTGDQREKSRSAFERAFGSSATETVLGPPPEGDTPPGFEKVMFNGQRGYRNLKTNQFFPAQGGQ